MATCEEFRREIEAAIGPVLDRIGATFERYEEYPPCHELRVYYATDVRDLYFYNPVRDSEVNCMVRETSPPDSEWVPIRGAVGWGAGLSVEELAALFPVGYFPTNEEMLIEIGGFLEQLPWARRA